MYVLSTQSSMDSGDNYVFKITDTCTLALWYEDTCIKTWVQTPITYMLKNLSVYKALHEDCHSEG